MKKIVLVLAGMACLAASGCASYAAAVPSQQGKAYVTSSGMFGQHMLLCDATGPKPVCKELEEK
jgi:hypothetical protein